MHAVTRVLAVLAFLPQRALYGLYFFSSSAEEVVCRCLESFERIGTIEILRLKDDNMLW